MLKLHFQNHHTNKQYLQVFEEYRNLLTFLGSSSSVLDPITLNLDPDPGLWSNLDPDPGLYNQFSRNKSK